MQNPHEQVELEPTPIIPPEVPHGVGFVQRELDRIAVALRQAPNPECYAQLSAAQQALSWALEPVGFAAPYDTIMRGTQAATEGCSEIPHPPLS
jgi:hypothetical protein